MSKKLLALAIFGITFGPAAQAVDNGYLNPANEEDYALILEHMGYAGTNPMESPMFYRMVEEAREEALEKKVLPVFKNQTRQLETAKVRESAAVANVVEKPVRALAAPVVTKAAESQPQETIHHSLLMPKLFKNTNTQDTRLMNSATVNVTGDLNFGYTTVVLKDPAGKQVGVPGSRRAFASDANRSLALGNVDSKYIADNYEDGDVFTIESVAMVQDKSGNRQFHTTKNFIMAKALKTLSSDSSYNGSLVINEPSQNQANQDAGADNIKVCLNRDHGDCDIPQMYPRNTPNANLKIRLPLSGEIETFHEIVEIMAPGTGNATIADTGAWVMAGNASAAGEWASMRNPTDGRTLMDYVEMRHFIEEGTGFVGTRLAWEIPMEETEFGVGADTTGTLFKRFENVQWEIRLKVKTRDAIDFDGDLNTTDDRFYPFTDANGDPEIIETVFVAENADVDSEHSDWIFEEKLPYLYFEYSCIAKGTLIQMQDGSQKPIEEIVEGELIASNGQTMQVMDTSIGYEAIPMVAIEDNKGNVVLLTETHPVVTLNRGVVWASEVVVGDKLSTNSGESKVVNVSEEMFNDTVHNLELEPVTGEDEAQETMFANGIAVGDLGYQSDMSFKDKAVTTVESVLEDLPEEWHQDYLNSLK